MSEITASGAAAKRREEESARADEAGWLEKLKSRLGFSDATDLRGVIEDALEKEEGRAESFSAGERAMLQNLLRFGELKVEDVMVPRADIVAIDENAPLGELLRKFTDAGHSRIPVYKDTLDDPRGMIHIKDLMAWITTRASKRKSGRTAERRDEAVAGLSLKAADLSKPVSFTKIMRNALFVPPSMSVRDLLFRMQTTHIHLAIVVDEYGGTDGLVSIEDLVEEIVGDIEDEHDSNGGPMIREVAGEGLLADARAEVEELEARLGLKLIQGERDEDVDTLGGLVFTLAGRVPVKGEIVRHESGIEFEVLDADPRRVKTLRILRKDGEVPPLADAAEGR